MESTLSCDGKDPSVTVHTLSPLPGVHGLICSDASLMPRAARSGRLQWASKTFLFCSSCSSI